MGALKFKLTIAYDGSAYHGWQTRKTGMGVQDAVERALAEIFPSGPRVVASSRTDSGVHALGLVAHFEVCEEEFHMTTRHLALAINALLPADVRVISAMKVSSSFHARFDASGKQYLYQVWNHAVMNPLLRDHAWHAPHPLDMDAMRKAAAWFVGRHDFRAFTSKRDGTLGSAVRTLSHCTIRRKGPLVTFVLEGDGFLYKMCRGIVGTLVQTGAGKFSPDEMQSILESRDRRNAGVNAPAYGLVLNKVFYRHRGKDG